MKFYNDKTLCLLFLSTALSPVTSLEYGRHSIKNYKMNEEATPYF